jgi:hypothetical protein
VAVLVVIGARGAILILLGIWAFVAIGATTSIVPIVVY